MQDDDLYKENLDMIILSRFKDFEDKCYEMGIRTDDYMDVLRRLDRDYLGQRLYIKTLEKEVEESYSD